MPCLLADLRISEDPQEKSVISLVEAFTAALRGQAETALRCAREAFSRAPAIGVGHESVRWAWPVAARAAWELRDHAATSELVGLLGSYPDGHLAPMLRAERDLVRARLAAADGDPGGEAAFASAITGLRELSTPYHLAHGLLDHAEYLARRGDAEAAVAAVEEARGIAGGLGCQPLLDRAEDLDRARPRIPG